MRKALIGLVFGMAFAVATPAAADVSIGINVPTYPRLVAVPGVPVYYAPTVAGNYFFYDGLYWVFQGNGWYASDWYNGPWRMVPPDAVPLYVLRVPVRYYRYPPPYFRGWRADYAPRWGERWGRDWEARRSGWDQWDHRRVPRPAPPPVYQRSFAGDRYPREVEQQRSIHAARYGYQPHEPVTRQYYGDPGNWRGEHERRDGGEHRPPGHSPRGEGRGRGEERGEGHR